jgi:general secretion pathway protein G
VCSAHRKARAGFTLLEILVVITVIAILAALVSPQVFRNVGDAKSASARAQVEILTLALDAYRLDNDHYPASAQGLEALVRRPGAEPLPRNWRGPYLRRGVPMDPWNRPYEYTSPGVHDSTAFDLATLGRDGERGGAGEDADITSWDGLER